MHATYHQQPNRNPASYVFRGAQVPVFGRCLSIIPHGIFAYEQPLHSWYLAGGEWGEGTYCTSLTALTLPAGDRTSDAAAKAAIVEHQLAVAATSPEQALMDALATTRTGKQHLCQPPCN